MLITLNQPKYPYRTNRYYRHLLERLMDSNIYDTSYVAVGKRAAFERAVINHGAPFHHVNGILPNGTYYYSVVGITAYGETLPSLDFAVTLTGTNNTVNIGWFLVQGATSYNVFRSTTPGEYGNKFIFNTQTNTFTDTGYVEQIGYPLASAVDFSGAVTPAGAYTVQLMKKGAGDDAFSVMAEGSTGLDGTFKFTGFSLPRGENEIYAVVSNERSASVFLNVYNLHLYFEAIANEFLYQFQERFEQDRADIYLKATQDILDTELRLPSLDALQEIWGTLTDAFLPSGFTSQQYAQFINDTLYCYRNATTFEAIKHLYDFMTSGIDLKRVIYYDKGSYTFKIGDRFGFRAVRTFGIGNPTLDYSWTGGNLFFGGQRGYIPSGTGSITPSTDGLFILYIDGTRDINGYFNIKTAYAATTTLGYAPALPDGVRVLAVFYVAGQDIVKIYGQCFVGTPSSIGLNYNGPYHMGPSFICSNARIMSTGFRGSRFMVYFTSIFGSGPFTDPEYQKKTKMIHDILMAVKPAKTTVAFGYAPLTTMIEV